MKLGDCKHLSECRGERLAEIERALKAMINAAQRQPGNGSLRGLADECEALLLRQ